MGKDITPGAAALAFLGDAVYSLRVREMLVAQDVPFARLSPSTGKIVAAKAQAAAYRRVFPHATPDEQAIMKRGRNLHNTSRAKGASISDYRHATGLEALFGFLHHQNNHERIAWLFEICMEGGLQ